MGWVTCIAECFGCKKVFGFNPNKVPSIRVSGNKEPICQSCVEWANPLRVENGLEEIQVDPEAYRPLPEEAL